MGSFFVGIYNFFSRHKVWLWICTILSFLLAGFFAWQIKLENDITRILPQDKTLNKLQQVFSDSRFADKLVITISQKDTTRAADPDSLTAYSNELATRVNDTLKPYIKEFQAQVQETAVLDLMQVIQQHLPVFLEADDYKKIDSLITPSQLQTTLKNNYNTLISPTGLVTKKVIASDPVGMSWLGIKKLQHLQYDEQFELYDGFIMTRDHRHLMMFITPENPPSATSKNAEFLEGLQAQMDALQKVYPNVDASFFGGTAVSAGNAQQLKQDSILTSSVTVVLLILLIVFFFKKKRAPVLVMVPVVFGALFSLACIWMIQTSIAVVAIGVGAIVLGIAVNYSLHVFNHYRHTPDIREVIRDLATPMTVGSFTTVGGFLCLQLVESPILQDVGLFAALSLVGAALFSLIFLPHWIVMGEQPEHPAHSDNWLDKLAARKPEKNKYVVGGIFILTIVFFFTAKNVGFESNMMRMNFMRPELQESERKLNEVNAYTAQTVYLITDGKNLDNALQNSEIIQPVIKDLQQKGFIHKVAGVNALMISEKEQQIRIKRWKDYWTKEKQSQLITYLRAHGAEAGFKSAAFNPFSEWLQQDFTIVPEEAMQTLQKGPLGDFITDKNKQVSVISLLRIDPAHKAEVYNAFQHEVNTTVLDKQYVTNRLVEVMQSEFNSIAWMTSLLVFFALLLSYGRIELALITFIPMLISWVWILGIMGLFGIKFNIINIILSTFIFGLGDDYSIFTMDGLLQKYQTGKEDNLSSFRSSIFLSAITTILGIGALIFAQHPSLKSIALIAIIGICCVVLISQVMIPFLFNWLITNRVAKGRAPWTLKGWVTSVFAFSYFAFGSLLLTVTGWILIRLNPFKKEKGKVLYHRILSAYTWSVMYIMGNFRKRIINPLKENLDTPAVIISNHQSFLDILISTMLHPKVILLTNKWVWNSPVFGAVVKLADYYPVADGVEGSVEQLRDRVKEGYSIVVYPEGTRSPDIKMKRFHKGAFYIAQELGLDILPIIIHGTAYTMSKNDFLLKDGPVTVKYLPRIKAGDEHWGENYSARTKQISKYFKAEYETLRQEIEIPVYYKEQLKYNYIYKGPVLEWYMRIKTGMEKYYALFHELLPKQGRILDIGCGYGFMSYMLHFLSEERELLGLDYDEEKIVTAQHGYLKGAQLNFECVDITKYKFDNYDAFVISDVLHYLEPAQQEQVLAECINKLNPGGIIVVRDGDLDLEKRHKKTLLTEFFSTKVIGFNKTQNRLTYLSSARMQEIVQRYGATMEQIDNNKYLSNVIFIIKKQ